MDEQLTSIQQTIADISEGCPGTLTTLLSLSAGIPELEMELILLVLGLHDISGSGPAVLYKDCCDNDFRRFYKLIYLMAYNFINIDIIKNAISDRRSLKEEIQEWSKTLDS